MKKYEILEHAADLKIRVFGNSKEDLFSNALLAMIDALRPETAEEKIKEEIIKIESSDLPSLLVDFLSEILYLIQINKASYNKVKFKKFTDLSVNSEQAEIEAELSGEVVKRFGEDIKAVTYHNLEIKKVNDRWEAVVLFDI